jgi:hypothetical protein
MTNDDVRLAQQRIAEMREISRGALDLATTPTPAAAAGRVVSWRVGFRALDRVTGREGEVSNVVTSDDGQPARVYIRFDDGGAAVRLASDLVARPRPPAARS